MFAWIGLAFGSTYSGGPTAETLSSGGSKLFFRVRKKPIRSAKKTTRMNAGKTYCLRFIGFIAAPGRDPFFWTSPYSNENLVCLVNFDPWEAQMNLVFLSPHFPPNYYQ